MSEIATFHNTFVRRNSVSGDLYHALTGGEEIIVELENGASFFMVGSEYFGFDADGRMTLSAEKQLTPFVLNSDGTYSFMIGDSYLSARKDGTLSLAPKLLDWEKFFLAGHSVYDDWFDPLNCYLKKNQSCAVLICSCGPHKYNSSFECFHTDLNPNLAMEVYKLDASKKFRCPDSIFNYIYSEHGIEHLDLAGIINFFSESFRCLKPNGVLRIATPGLDNWIKYYVINDQRHEEITNVAVKMAYKQADYLGIRSKALTFNNVMRNYGHQLILDFDTYEKLLLATGFLKVSQAKMGESAWPPLKNIERRHGLYSEFETLVIEARK